MIRNVVVFIDATDESNPDPHKRQVGSAAAVTAGEWQRDVRLITLRVNEAIRGVYELAPNARIQGVNIVEERL